MRTDLPIPHNFPVDNYEAIASLVTLKLNDTNKDEFSFFIDSWKGFLHRFLACTEHDKNFREWVSAVAQNDSSYKRYAEDRELFNFFVNGLSAIECLCCALFAIGAIEEIAQTGQRTNLAFSIKTEKDLKHITPTITTERFQSQFVNVDITATLKNLFDDKSITEDAAKYKEWKKIRDILAHRAQPGRLIAAASDPGEYPDYLIFRKVTKEGVKDLPTIKFANSNLLGIKLDPNTTASMHEWLTKIINNILSASYIFVNNSSV
jgi:hypothetical protein